MKREASYCSQPLGDRQAVWLHYFWWVIIYIYMSSPHCSEEYRRVDTPTDGIRPIPVSQQPRVSGRIRL